MGGILFQYGTAFHLALLTVAPLFLSPVCDSRALTLVLCWLSLLAAIWIVMNPSQRFGEWPRDARQRIGYELVRDPFLYVGFALLAISAVRALNGGIELGYDFSTGLWRLKGPAVEILPGSVSGAGVLPLAGVLALSVVTLGVRHALGGRARLGYLLFCGILAALAIGCWLFLQARGVPVYGLARLSELPVFFGSALGVFLLFALAAWVELWESDSSVLGLVAAVAASVLMFGLLRFAPVSSVWCFLGLSILFLLLGLFLAGFHRSPTAWLRMTVGFLLISAPALSLALETNWLAHFWPFFPDGFLPARAAASSVAVEAWKESSRMGVGLGAYPLALGFFASPADWQVLNPLQQAVPNGWIQFVFERGFLGCAALAVALFFLGKDMLLRFVRAPRGFRFSVLHVLGPLVLAVCVAVTFVECTFVQVELLIPVCSVLALTAAAFPDAEEEDHG